MLKDFGLMNLRHETGRPTVVGKSACLISGEGHLTILVIVFPPIKTLRFVEMSVQEDGLGLEISGYCSLDSLAAGRLFLKKLRRLQGLHG
jgi:hypothetical protein